MSDNRRRSVLVIILAAWAMVVIDASIVVTALPKIRVGLNFSATGLSWVQNAYTLAFGGLLLLGARAGDILGRRRMFITGLALFTATSLAVGLAQSPTWLIIARALQGAGGAVLAPSTLALLSTNFAEGKERTRAVAYYAAVAAVGASVGLLFGGIFTDLLSWRFAFFINLPIGIVLIIAARRHLSETEQHAGRFDLVGAFCSTVGMTALVYGVVRSADMGWADPITIASLITSVVLFVILVVNEARAAQPIMPLHLFASRERSAAYAARILILGAMFGYFFFITQYLQGVKGYSPLQAGMAFLPMTIVNAMVAMAVPRLAQSLGNQRLLVGGITCSLLGMLWLSRLSTDTPYLTGIALPMIMLGIGHGAAMSPLTASGIADVLPKDAGAASGLVNVAHQLGGSLGVAILVAIFAAADSITLHGQDLFAHRISSALTGGAVMLALALMLAITLIAKPRNGRPAP